MWAEGALGGRLGSWGDLTLLQTLYLPGDRVWEGPAPEAGLRSTPLCLSFPPAQAPLFLAQKRIIH